MPTKYLHYLKKYNKKSLHQVETFRCAIYYFTSLIFCYMVGFTGIIIFTICDFVLGISTGDNINLSVTGPFTTRPFSYIHLFNEIYV